LIRKIKNYIYLVEKSILKMLINFNKNKWIPGEGKTSRVETHRQWFFFFKLKSWNSCIMDVWIHCIEQIYCSLICCKIGYIGWSLVLALLFWILNVRPKLDACQHLDLHSWFQSKLRFRNLTSKLQVSCLFSEENNKKRIVRINFYFPRCGLL